MTKYLFLFANCLLLTAFSFAHGDDDHGDKKKEIAKSGKPYFTISSVSDVFEMVLRYDPIDAGHEAKMKLFVSDFETNKPIDSAKIEITCTDDDKLRFIVKQIDKGTYIIEGTFPGNKKYSLVANISAGENADLMTLEGIEVGKGLENAEGAQHIETSFFSWKTIGAFIAGIIFCTLFIWIITRKKRVSITH